LGETADDRAEDACAEAAISKSRGKRLWPCYMYIHKVHE